MISLSYFLEKLKKGTRSVKKKVEKRGGGRSAITVEDDVFLKGVVPLILPCFLLLAKFRFPGMAS